MPSRHYRRNIRAATSGTPMINKFVTPPVIAKQRGDCELTRIRNYFLDAMDLIIQHMNFRDAVVTVQGIMASVKSRAEYYPIIHLIEKQMLSTLMNISNSVNPKLIQIRLDYIKSFIDELPYDAKEVGPISKMIQDVIDILVDNVYINPIIETMEYVQSYIREKYGVIQTVETAQHNILNIIECIGRGTPTGIITVRVEYVKDSLATLLAEPS